MRIAVLALAAALACHAAKPVQVTQSDDGKTISVLAGQPVEVRLPVQAGTGFSWQVQQAADSSLKVETLPAKPAAGPGGATEQVMRVVTKQSRKYELVFHYVRPWEKDVPPAQSFRITLRSRK